MIPKKLFRTPKLEIVFGHKFTNYLYVVNKMSNA